MQLLRQISFGLFKYLRQGSGVMYVPVSCGIDIQELEMLLNSPAHLLRSNSALIIIALPRQMSLRTTQSSSFFSIRLYSDLT